MFAYGAMAVLFGLALDIRNMRLLSAHLLAGGKSPFVGVPALLYASGGIAMWYSLDQTPPWLLIVLVSVALHFGLLYASAVVIRRRHKSGTAD